MKMAAAEALYETEQPASFSIFTIGTLDGSRPVCRDHDPGPAVVPGHRHARRRGRGHQRPAGASTSTEYGPGDYTPIIPVTYWTFRLMIGFGAARRAGRALGAVGPCAGAARRPTGGWSRAGLVLPLLPLAGNSVGWIFTEMGRQPWIVFGEMLTARRRLAAASATGEVVTSLVGVHRCSTACWPSSRCGCCSSTPGPGCPSPLTPAAPGPPDDDQDRPLDVRVLRRPSWSSRPSGSSSSPCCSPATSCSRASTSASACCCRSSAATRRERRVMINTIGPVWDGNEVWLITAGGAMFAAFPEWYATLFSGFYLPLLLILVALIVRGVAFEYRGKRPTRDLAGAAGTWRSSSARVVPALLWGVAFANIVRGVPLDADHEYVGSLLDLLNPYALLGGLTHARRCSSPTARSSSRSRPSARSATGPTGSPPAPGWSPRCWPSRSWRGRCSASAAPRPRSLVGAGGGRRAGRSGWSPNRVRREGWAFAGTAAAIGLAVATLFAALYPDVLPSTTDPAGTPDRSTTRPRTPYTLKIMTWVARGLHPDRAALPGLDLLGLPPPDRGREHSRLTPRLTDWGHVRLRRAGAGLRARRPEGGDRGGQARPAGGRRRAPRHDRRGVHQHRHRSRPRPCARRCSTSPASASARCTARATGSRRTSPSPTSPPAPQHVIGREIDVIRNQLARNRVDAAAPAPAASSTRTPLTVTDAQRPRVARSPPRRSSSPPAPGRPARPVSTSTSGPSSTPTASSTSNACRARMVVVGAGVIGIEYASMFAALGTKVTVVERRDRMLEFCDLEIVEALKYHLRDLAVTFRFGETVAAVERHAERRDRGAGERQEDRRRHGHVLRRPAGHDRRARPGHGRPDAPTTAAGSRSTSTSAPSVPHIYAVGDVIGFPALAVDVDGAGPAGRPPRLRRAGARDARRCSRSASTRSRRSASSGGPRTS